MIEQLNTVCYALFLKPFNHIVLAVLLVLVLFVLFVLQGCIIAPG